MGGIADAARKIPGVAAAEGVVTGTLATAQDLPIQDYDNQRAENITRKLKGFSQRELRTINAYEHRHQNRTTIIDKIAKLTGDEPWSGYDELSAEAIAKAVSDGDQDLAKKVRGYERDHKDRAGVIAAAGRHIDAK